MADLETLASQVAARLAQYGAEVDALPEFAARDAKTLRVSVIPFGTELKTLSRGSVEMTDTVQVGFVKKATADDVPELTALVRGIGKGLLRMKADGATCTGVAFEPVYSAAHLRDKGLFVSLVTLTFKAAE